MSDSVYMRVRTWVLSTSMFAVVCSLCVVLSDFPCVCQKVTEPYGTLIHQRVQSSSLPRKPDVRWYITKNKQYLKL